MKCKECRFFEYYRIHDGGFRIGSCDKEPVDVDSIDMKSDRMAVQCVHDGSISVGEDFGCIHFEQKRPGEREAKKKAVDRAYEKLCAAHLNFVTSCGTPTATYEDKKKAEDAREEARDNYSALNS